MAAVSAQLSLQKGVALLAVRGVATLAQDRPDRRLDGVHTGRGEVVGGVTVQTLDVLADPEIREGIKLYGNWPTIPQLYVKGEFIGGSDIMMEMYESGELKQVLGT